MSEISVIMTSDEHRAYQALVKMAEGLKNVEGGVKKITKESKEAEKEQQSLARAAKKVWDDAASPMEKHKQRLLELNVLLHKGMIDQEAYGRAAKKSFNEAMQGTRNYGNALQEGLGTIRDLAGALIGVGGVLGAVTLVKAAYMDWREEIKRLGEEHHKYAKEFIVDLSIIGDKGQEAAISGWLREGAGATPDQKRRIFKGVSQEAAQVSLLDRMQLTDEAVRALPLLSEAERETFGHTVGNVYDPRLSARANVSKAFKARELAKDHAQDVGGDKFEKTLATLRGAGMESNAAMGLILESMISGDQRNSALTAAAEAIDKDYDPRGMGRKTPEDLAKLKFAKASREERWRLLRTDKATRQAILGDKGALFAGINFEEGQEFGKQLTAAERGDAIGEARARIAKTPEGIDVIESQKLEVEKFRNETANRELGSRLERAERRFEAYNSQFGWFDRSLNRVDWALSKTFNPEAPERSYVSKKLGGFDPDKERNLRPEWKEFYQSAEAEEAKIREAQKNAKEANELLKQQLEELKKISANNKSPHPTAVQNARGQHGEK